MSTWPAAVPPPAPTRRTLSLIFGIMLLDIIGLTIIIPVLPFIVERFRGDAFTITALSGVYAAAQFLAAPALGLVSDRVGRRPVLLVCLAGSAVGYVIFGLGGALWVLFLARVLDGITGGNISTAAACIADVSAPEDRPKNFGLIGMAYGLGFIIGPAIGGAVSGISIDAPAYAAALLSLVSFAVIYFLLPETLPAAVRRRQALTLRELNPLAAIGAMARKPGIGVLLVVSCLFAFGFDAMNSTLGIYAAKVFAAEPWQIGVLFVVSGVITAFTQAVLVPRVVGRFGEKTMAVISQIGLSLGASIIALAPALWWLYPNALIISGVGGFIWSTVGSLLAARVAPQEQGSLAGVNTALQSLMAVCGPLVAGVAYDQVAPAAPFGMSACIFLAAAATMLSVRVGRRPAEAPAARAMS